MARDSWSDGRRHRGWLAGCRLAAAALLAGLALFGEASFASPGGLWLAAAAAALLGAATVAGPPGRYLGWFLLLGDLAWVSLSVVAAGRPDSGLTLLYALVALAAGLTVGRGAALSLGVIAAVALVLAAGAVGMLLDAPVTVFAQSALVLVLGGVADRMRGQLEGRDRALEYASEVLERIRLDTDTIVQHLGSGLLSVDTTGRVVHCNVTAAATLGLDAEEAVGRPVAEVLEADRAELAAEIENGLASGYAAHRREVTVSRDGVPVPLGLSLTVLRSPAGETRGVAVLFQDLTDVKKEEALRRRRDRLAAVGELAAGIAHEIRNSVLPVSGSAQILSQELEPDEEQARLFELIRRETETIERFVSSLLSYTGSRPLRDDEVDLADLAEDVCRETEVGRPDGPRLVRDTEPLAVTVDRSQLHQVLRNLVLNAADAAGPEGRVTVRTGVGDDGVWLEVEDDGPGIPPDEAESVFRPFYTTKAGGTGLGLPIAARIAEDHGGELHLDRAGKRGTRFRLVLPRERARATAEAA